MPFLLIFVTSLAGLIGDIRRKQDLLKPVPVHIPTSLHWRKEKGDRETRVATT